MPVAALPGVFLPRIPHLVFLIAECSGVVIPLLVVRATVTVAVRSSVELVVRRYFIFRVIRGVISFSCNGSQVSCSSIQP